MITKFCQLQVVTNTVDHARIGVISFQNGRFATGPLTSVADQ